MNTDHFLNGKKKPFLDVCVMGVYFVWSGVNLRIVNGLIEIILSRKRLALLCMRGKHISQNKLLCEVTATCV